MRRSLWLSFAILATLLVIPSSPAQAGGVFSLNCGDAGRRSDDPIVFPNQPGASHMHQFFGSVTTNAHSTYQSMRRSATTCRLSADTAGYWMPTLLDPTGKVVPLLRATAYYRADTKVRAFPPDFRVISGESMDGSGMNTGTGKKLGWSCSDTAPYLATIPRCGGSKPFVKAHIVFPICWDGMRTDSSDHRSHVVHPSRGCPPGFDTRLPRLAIHFTFAAPGGPGYNLSSDAMFGTSAGRSLHADFWNTWDQTVLERLVATCLNGTRSCGFLH
jgi:Domain of unknown function (DUF1996)